MIQSMFCAWLAASLRGSLLILLIIALRTLLRRRLPAQCFHLLWIFVAVRMLVPIAPQTRWSIFNFIRPHHERRVVSITPYRSVVSEQVDVTNSDGASNEMPSKPAAITPPSDRDRFFAALPWLWLTGVAIQLAGLGAAALALQKRIRRASPSGDSRLQTILAECQEAGGWRGPLPVREVHGIGGPAVVGLWRPVLVLPVGLAERLSDEDLRAILLHELAHLRRRDLAVLWLFTITRTVHWFNPLAWLATRLARTDLELACDESVLQSVNRPAPAAYGETLLKLARMVTCHPPSLPMAGILDGKRALQYRVRCIALHSRRTAANVAAAALLVGTIGLAFGANEAVPPGPAVDANQYGLETVAQTLSDASQGASRQSNAEWIASHLEQTDSPQPTPGASFANGWKVMQAHRGKPALIRRADGSELSLFDNGTSVDGIVRERTALLDVNKYAIVLRKGHEVQWLDWPSWRGTVRLAVPAEASEDSLAPTFVTGGEITKLYIRSNGTGVADFKDSYGTLFRFDSDTVGVGKVVSFEPMEGGHWWKVILQKGNARGAAYANSRVIDKLADHVPQIEVSAQFIALPPGGAASLQIPGKSLPVPLRAKPEERLVSPREADALILESADEFQKFVSQNKAQLQSGELLSSPRVTTRSKQHALIEVIRENRHPITWKPDPEKAGAWKPADFETTNTGVTLEVTPEAKKSGVVSLDVTPQIVNFLGCLDLDSEKTYPVKAQSEIWIKAMLNPDLTPVPKDADAQRLKYIFSTRKGHLTVDLHNGEALVLVGLNETEDIAPFSSQTANGDHDVIVVIQAQKIDQNGEPVDVE